MKKKINKLSLICLIICSVLCLALIVTQFIPFWTAEVQIKTEEGETITQEKDFSVWGYLSFPEDETQKQLGKDFEKTLGKDVFNINDLAGTACMILAFGILTIIFTACCYDKAWTFIFPLVCGISSLLGYLTQPVLQMGNLWIIPVVLSGLITAAAMLAGVGFFISIKQWLVDEV